MYNEQFIRMKKGHRYFYIMLKIYVWIMVIPGRDIFIFMLFATLEK
jgi:hypothetical protein